MQRRVEVLRYKAGQRTTAPPPEVFWERAPRGVPPEAGEELLILVDLDPYIPHRARELRTLAEETYWTASGSITARMRRAIAEANRYLVQQNAEVHAGLRTYGSITLITFAQDEAFIGQTGPGNTLIHYPSQRLMELFPKPERPLTPLGVAVPPIIHISYATLEPGCQVACLTNSIMQTRYIPAWESLLAEQAAAPDQDIFAAALAQKQVNGGAIHVLCLADEEVPPAPPAPRDKKRPVWLTGRASSASAPNATAASPAASPHAVPHPPAETPTPTPEEPSGPHRLRAFTLGAGILTALWQRLRRPAHEQEPLSPAETSASFSVTTSGEAVGLAERAKPAAPQTHATPPASPRLLQAVPDVAPAGAEIPLIYPTRSTDDATLATTGEARPEGAPSDGLAPSDEAPPLKRQLHALRRALRPRARPAEEGADLSRTLDAALPAPRRRSRSRTPYGITHRAARFIQKTLMPLLPGGRAVPPSPPRPVPAEQRWFPWLALMLALLVFLTAGVTYAEMGGSQRATALLEEARKARDVAYEQQTAESWRKVQSLAQMVLVLDANNAQAQGLREEATLALDALQKAALLAIQPMRELGVSPQPRRLIATATTVYVLNPATDEVMAVDVREPGAVQSLLKRGQTLNGQMVPHLVDMAWMAPAPGYRDGALFVYGEGGVLYTYEPTLGRESITMQRLPGELPPGAVTMIGVLGSRLYIVERQANRLLSYQPVNGLYSAPPRPYFAPALTPPLQTVVGMALDGRVYLLFGDGTLRAYYEGTEDPGFQVTGITEPQFQPTMLALEADPNGAVCLADARQELIVVLNRKGQFRHQFRLPGHMGRSLEALALAPDGKTVYLVAENKLYAAPLPDFAQ